MRIDRRVEPNSLQPTATQELLLRAALSECRRAHEAFAAWKKDSGCTEYADVDFLSTNLLSCVYGNFARSNVPDPWLPQLAGLHRYHWARNAARQDSFLEVVERFHRARLEFVVLGGFALLAGKYLGGLGERPLLDAEFVLRPSHAASARRVFASLGWLAVGAAPPPVAGWRSERWRGPNELTLKVHFRWLPKPYPVVGIDRLSRHAALGEVGGVPLPIPGATDLLLHACVCSRLVHEDIRRQFLWVADAIRVLQHSGPNLDWERLWQESRPLCTRLPLRDALEYLHTEFDAPVPESWLAKSRQVVIPPAETLPFYRSTRQRTGRPAGQGIMNRPWDGYVAAEQAAGRTPCASGLLRYLIWRASVELRKLARFGAKRSPISPAQPTRYSGRAA
jgi:hypothetical protein